LSTSNSFTSDSQRAGKEDRRSICKSRIVLAEASDTLCRGRLKRRETNISNAGAGGASTAAADDAAAAAAAAAAASTASVSDFLLLLSCDVLLLAPFSGVDGAEGPLP